MIKNRRRRVIVIASQFPEAHETFIARELLELHRQGVPLEIVSLKRCRDRFIYRDVRKLLHLVVYPGWKLRLASAVTMVYFAVVHPLRFWGALLLTVWDHFRHPVYLAKLLSVVPRGTYLAFRIRRRRQTLLHAHWATVPTFAAWFASRLSRRPYIFTAHAWDIFIHPGNLLRLISDSEGVITCTKYNRNFLHRKFAGKISVPIRVVYHGLELEKFPAGPASKAPLFTVLAVGRLVPQKGFDVLIRACDLLSRRLERFRCIIVGNGPERGKLMDMIYRKNLEHIVMLKGSQPHEEVIEQMRRAHVLAAPSVIAPNQDRDGIPNVILEAMALELPVVGSDVSGIPEVVIPHVTGLLVPERNPVALGTALEKLYYYPELRRELGRRGRWLIEEKFDVRKNVAQIVEMYNALLERP